MDYKVVVTAEAEEDLNQFIQYLLFAKKNKQAAKNVLDDFEDTIKKLKYVASSLNADRKYFLIIYDTVSSTELVIISIKKAGDKKSQKLFIYPLFTYTLTITTYEYNCND